MKIITAGFTSALLAVGVAGSVAAYRTQAATPDVSPASQETAEVSTATTPAKPKVRWAPCPEGSSLEKGTCVTDVVHTIVLPAPSPTAQPSAQAATTPQGEAQEDDSDHADDVDHDEADEAGEDDGGDHGDDHGDDDGDDDGDDHGEDHEDDDHDDDHEDEDED